jgi:hypothetical protein
LTALYNWPANGSRQPVVECKPGNIMTARIAYDDVEEPLPGIDW